MNWDLSRYVALFVSESREHLDALSAGLVRLETGGEGAADHAGVDDLFRHAHSLKGMAAAMQQAGIALVAHGAEDVIGAVRARGGPPPADVVDLLLVTTDALADLVREASVGGTPAAPDGLVGRLEAAAAQLEAAPAPPPAARGEPETAPGDEPGDEPGAEPATAAGPVAEGSEEAVPPAERPPRKLRITVAVAGSSPVPSLRGFLVLRRLGPAGRVVTSTPTEEELRSGQMPGRMLAIEFETDLPIPEVERKLSQVADLARVEVREAVEPPPGAPPVPRPSPPADLARSVRVRAEVLDELLDVAGELLLATARVRELGRPLPETARRAHEEGIDRLQSAVRDLHGRVMTARMTPLTSLTDRLPRAARDLARQTGKQVEVLVTGSEIEVDRSLLEEVSDPVLHLLRNAVDHGVEPAAERIGAGKRPTGRIEVSARRERDRVILEVADDGRGMDPAALREAAVARGDIGAEAAAALPDEEALLLCCLPGVSTAARVTDVSGRGVGMDAVKRSVEALSGSLSIASRHGAGTRFTLRLPLTVALQPVLLVGVGTEVMAIPVSKVHGAVQADPAGPGPDGAEEVAFGGGLVPVHDLGVLLGGAAAPAGERRSVVVAEAEEGRVGLAVDRLLGQQEAVLKPLHGPLALVPGLSAVTVLGSGRPVFVLDVARLVAA